VFYDEFNQIHPISLTRAQQKPKPAPATPGIGFIIDPFWPGAITNPSLNETFLSFDFVGFATFILCQISLRVYFYSRDKSQFQSLLFSFICWASLLYGVFVFYAVACLRAFYICFRVYVVVVVIFVFGWLRLFGLIVSGVRLFVCLLGS